MERKHLVHNNQPKRNRGRKYESRMKKNSKFSDRKMKELYYSYDGKLFNSQIKCS